MSMSLIPFMETSRIKSTAGCTNNHPGSKIQACDEDVMIQILLCLPVISLLRFKSVCKSWRYIIDSPFFIHLHATTLQQQQPSSFFKLGCCGGGSSLLFEELELFEEEEEEKKRGGNFFMLSGEEFEVFRDLGRPTLMGLGDEGHSMKFCVMGCCNGIIYLHDDRCYTRNFILWNPAIKQSRLVPKPSNLLGNPNCCYDDYKSYYVTEEVTAFGVDIKTKDYKLLLITTLGPRRRISDYDDDEERFMPSQSPHARRVHVYSSSTDSWRCIDHTTLSAAHPNHLKLHSYVDEGLYLNGSYFFIADCQIEVEEYFCTMPMIMSFDFTDEIFRTIQPPYDWRNNHTMESTVTSKVYFIPFDEKIALVDAKTDGFHRLECDVWLLNELHNGVKESWTKFYTFGHSYGSYRSPIQYPIALRCIANNGQFAIIYCSNRDQHVWKSQLFNLITGETKDLLSGVVLNVSIYKPSLVKIGRSGASTNEKCK